MSLIKLLLSGFIAAFLSLAANFIFRRAGLKRIALIGPVLEEVFKTGSALFFQAAIPSTHIVFGFLEAIVDFVWGEKKKVLAGFFGVLSHTVFGLITYFLINAGLPVYLGVLGAISAHIALNTAVMKISGERRQRY